MIPLLSYEYIILYEKHFIHVGFSSSTSIRWTKGVRLWIEGPLRLRDRRYAVRSGPDYQDLGYHWLCYSLYIDYVYNVKFLKLYFPVATFGTNGLLSYDIEGTDYKIVMLWEVPWNTVVYDVKFNTKVCGTVQCRYNGVHFPQSRFLIYALLLSMQCCV